MATRTCLLIVVSLCTFNSGASTATAQQGSNAFELHDITHAAEQRWEQFRSGRFEWTETKWMQKGSLSSAGEFGPSLPPEDVTHTYSNVFEFDGDKYRFERNGPTWNAREGKYIDTEHVGVWDGQHGSVLGHDLGSPRGEIYNRGWDLSQPPLRPLALGLRPLHPRWFKIDLSELVVADKNDSIGGFRCIAIETSPQAQSKGPRPWKHTYWFSPQQQFALVRYTKSLPTLPRPSEELSLVYAHDVKAGWYPSKWKRLEGGSGDRPSAVIEGTVTSYSLNEPPVAARFDFSFPAGTWVQDMRADGESYIVLPDGRKRPVTKQELLRGSTYKDLLKTDTGQGQPR